MSKKKNSPKQDVNTKNIKKKKFKSTLGVELEEKQESDSEYFIPNEINEAIKEALNGQMSIDKLYDENFITNLENLSFNRKKYLSDITINKDFTWVEELLQENEKLDLNVLLDPNINQNWAKGPFISSDYNGDLHFNENIPASKVNNGDGCYNVTNNWGIIIIFIRH